MWNKTPIDYLCTKLKSIYFKYFFLPNQFGFPYFIFQHMNSFHGQGPMITDVWGRLAEDMWRIMHGFLHPTIYG